jgi:hypothetical protein
MQVAQERRGKQRTYVRRTDTYVEKSFTHFICERLIYRRNVFFSGISIFEHNCNCIYNAIFSKKLVMSALEKEFLVP